MNKPQNPNLKFGLTREMEFTNLPEFWVRGSCPAYTIFIFPNLKLSWLCANFNFRDFNTIKNLDIKGFFVSFQIQNMKN